MRKLTRRQQLSAIALSVLALLFISLDFTGGALGGARGGTTGALGSLYRGTDSVIGPLRRFIQAIPDVGTEASLLSYASAIASSASNWPRRLPTRRPAASWQCCNCRPIPSAGRSCRPG